MPTYAGTGGRTLAHQEDRAFAEVTRERVDNLAEQVQRLEAKINTLVVLLIGQMLSFFAALALVIVNHVKF